MSERKKPNAIAGPTAEEEAGERPVGEIAEKSRELARRLPAIGHVTWLCSQSPSHRKMFVQDLEWRIFPPILLGQCKLHMDAGVGGLPTAFASWAYLSEEAESCYWSTHKLRPGDWRSGDRAWLVDFITPFGGAPKLLSELYYDIHKDRELMLLYPDENGEPVETSLSELVRRHQTNGDAGQDGDTDPPTTH